MNFLQRRVRDAMRALIAFGLTGIVLLASDAALTLTGAPQTIRDFNAVLAGITTGLIIIGLVYFTAKDLSNDR